MKQLTTLLILMSFGLAIAEPIFYGEPTKAVDALPTSYVTSPNAWFTVDEDKTLTWFNISEDSSTTNIVWQSTELPEGTPDATATNAIWQAIASNKLLAESGIKNWGNYAPDGTDNPEPDYMLFVNKPAMVVGSGIHFETSGAFSVMCSDGAVAYVNNGTDGSVRWGLGGDSYVSLVQGGSMLVGAKANSIEVDTNNNTVTVEYPYIGSGDFPTLYFSTSLGGDFTIVESPTWVDIGNGYAQVTIDMGSTTSGFFKATTQMEMSATFEANVPVVMNKGLQASSDVNVAPVVFDSVIEVEYNGNTYRVPAQLIEE